MLLGTASQVRMAPGSLTAKEHVPYIDDDDERLERRYMVSDGSPTLRARPLTDGVRVVRQEVFGFARPLIW